MTDLLDGLKAALADRYTIERELGRGGMAMVYLALDQKLGRDVALKVLRPELAASLGSDRFLREIEIAAKLNHPNILALYDCGEADGHLYYTMPYVEGESLRDRLNREKQLPIEDALQITREVADALGHAHSLGIVHRDIKPENILFAAGHAVVSDFGIARAVSEAGTETLTETGLAVGTPAYMSPEQASGSKDLDARSDLYSLGCVLYEMLSGEAPYLGHTPQAIVAKKLTEPAPRVSVIRDAVPAAIEAALGRALSRTPADRYRTARTFSEALAQPWAAPRRLPRRKWKVGIVAGAVIILGALGSWWVLLDDATRPDRGLVAVLPPENRTGDSRLDYLSQLSAERMIAYARGERIAEFVPLGKIEAARDANGPRQSVSALAGQTGAGLAVTGSYYLLGDTLRFQVELIDAVSDRQLSVVAPVSAARDAMTIAVNELAERVAVHLFVALDEGYLGLMDLQWGYPTMEALRLCREALDLNREGHFDESIARFLEAWKVDTLWVLPLWHASGPLHNKGDYAMSDSLTRIAFRLRDQVTEPSRFAILSSLAYYDGDFYLAQRYRCQALEAESGRTAVHAANCAYFSVRANRPQRALEAYEEAARVAGVPLLDLPPGPIAGWAVDAYHMMGDYTNELSTAGSILAEVPEIAPPIFHYASLRALIGSGRLHEVERGIEELATIAVSDIDAVERLLGLGLELRYHGHHEASTRALRRVERILTENVIDDSAGRRARLTHASVLYHLRDWDAAWRELQELHSLDSTSEVDENLEIALQGYSGLTAARIGDAESAATHEAWLRRRDDGARYLFGVPKGYIARIAAVQGRRDEAVGMLRQAHAEGLSYWPRWALQHQSRFDFESLADYGPYQDLMRPKG